METLDSPLPSHWVEQIKVGEERKMWTRQEENSSRWLSQKKQTVHGVLLLYPRQRRIPAQDLKYLWVFMEPLGHVSSVQFPPKQCSEHWTTSRDLKESPIPDSTLSLPAEFLVSSSKRIAWDSRQDQDPGPFDCLGIHFLGCSFVGSQWKMVRNQGQ